MAFRLAAGLLKLVGSGTLLCAGYYSLRSRTGEPALVVEEPNRVLMDVVAGKEYEVVFLVRNRSGEPARVIGSLPPD